MDIITLAPPDAIQPCVHCALEQSALEDHEIPTIFYGERYNQLIGVCPNHGVFELIPWDELKSHEEIMTQNYASLVMQANIGQVTMIRHRIKGQPWQYKLAIPNGDGQLKIIAVLLDPLHNELIPDIQPSR